MNKDTGVYPSKEKLLAIAREHGIVACGIADACLDIKEHSRYMRCVSELPAELSYLSRADGKRNRLSLWDHRAKSVLVCAFPYWDSRRNYASEMAAISKGLDGAFGYLVRTGRQNLQETLLRRRNARISRYAMASDYHRTVKEKLREVRDALKKINPAICGSVFCDTSPVMEKELARLAGLGFRGRNTLIISPKFGSWFFIGGLTLNFWIKPDGPCPLPDMPGTADACNSFCGGAGKVVAPEECGCGSCHICETSCPAQALSGWRLNPGRCYAFLTTQLKIKFPSDIPVPLYSYGCDLCQEKCPYNKH